jgi:hypothetical protein
MGRAAVVLAHGATKPRQSEHKSYTGLATAAVAMVLRLVVKDDMCFALHFIQQCTAVHNILSFNNLRRCHDNPAAA